MKIVYVAAVVFIFSCNATKNTTVTNSNAEPPRNISVNGKLFTALFMQRAAEYRALCLQAFNVARLRIDQYNAIRGRPAAIITDIDETVFDNSAYAVHQGLQGIEYESKSWYEWTDKSAADTLPGVGSLLKYAASKNIQVFYVTNREERERISTLKNLNALGLPNADNAHLIVKQTTSSKEQRRQDISKNFDVVFLMGDNLADFSVLFDKKNEAERKDNVERLSGEFGKKFIVLPNPNYGDWESSLYKNRYNYTQQQKDSVMRSLMRGY